MKPVYLDYHATTPVDPRVVEAMAPYFSETFGNPSSKTHRYGWDAAEGVQRAREQVAALLGASAKEIVFTSGGTEANNLAILGAARAARAAGGRDGIVTAATEHSSVIDSCRYLARQGFRVTFLPVNPDGLIDLQQLADVVDDRTILVSVMAANNEIGVLQPLEEIAAIASSHDALLHSDCVQAAGKIPFDARRLGIDLASVSSHKIYGPKGVGALVVRRRKPAIPLEPLVHGGGQEQGLRPGTLNVPGIVGMGRAAEICREELETESRRLGSLRDRLLAELRSGLDGIDVNGSLERRLPQNLNIRVAHVDPDALLLGLGDLAVSTGSACASGAGEPSHVLKALGVDDARARASIRFGLGRFTTDDDVHFAATRLVQVVQHLRAKLHAAS